MDRNSADAELSREETRHQVRNDDITDRLNVENITERCRKARLGGLDTLYKKPLDSLHYFLFASLILARRFEQVLSR